MDEVVRKALEEQHRLKIIRRRGCGGFAEVYEAESAQGVRCAVKVSLARLDGGGPGMQNQAIQKELENLQLVQTIAGHPRVVTLMDYWVLGGYLVTRWELSTEGSLADLLEQHVQVGRPGIPLKDLLRYIKEAAEGIDFLNGRGIYHRDIKPQNLLLFHGYVKVADLGLAKFAGASTATHTGSGTLGYLPPEAYEEHRLSKTVGLYNLAATYLKLRTGRDPFGTNLIEIVKRQEKGDPIVDGLERSEAEWVRRAVAFRPDDRPQEGALPWVHRLYEQLSQRANQPGVGQAEPNARPPATADRAMGGGADPALRPPSSPKLGLLDDQAALCLALTPDGRRAVSGSGDNTLRVWDLQSGACLHTLRGHTGLVWCLVITPDGRRAVSGSWDKTLRVWDLQAGACLHELRGHTDWVRCLAITPNGRRAVSGSDDTTLRVWDLQSGVCLHELRGHTDWVRCLAITPDGRRAVSGSRDYTLRVWHLQRGVCLHELRGHTESVVCLAIRPDGRGTVSGSRDTTLRVWDLQSGNCLHELLGHTEDVLCLALTPDGRSVVSGSRDTTLRVWDLQSGNCLHELFGHTDLVRWLALTADGRHAFSGGGDDIRVWELP